MVHRLGHCPEHQLPDLTDNGKYVHTYYSIDNVEHACTYVCTNVSTSTYTCVHRFFYPNNTDSSAQHMHPVS